MAPTLALRLVTYLLVCNGIAALLLAGLIGPVGTALVALAILGSWWLERARGRGVVREWIAWALVGTTAIAIAMDLIYLASTALDGMVHLLLFLIVARLFLRRSLRDLRDAGFLSFFLLVAASSVTFSVGFVVVFTTFLVLATWMLILHHVVAETQRAGDVAGGAMSRVDFRGRLARISLIGAAATFVITGVLFFVIPRVGQATLPLRSKFSRMVTGFSDRVELGAYGQIETDQTVVMRVYVTDTTDDPSLLPNLRWRGIVFDRFDGRTWAVGRPDRFPARRWPNGRFVLGTPPVRGPLLKQDIYLDPIGTDIIFAAPRAMRIDLSGGVVTVDDMDSLAVPNASARLHYQVESELEPPLGAPVHPSMVTTRLSERARNRYLQLPPLSPAIARLAHNVTARSRSPRDAAVRLTDYLSTNFRYTLAKPQTSIDPLDEFLFDRRSGNCEYFAAALAVMLRTLEIPARVVGGFQRGEWNPYGRYFMVRLSDAHAWVEAYFDGVGWVTLDASPRAAIGADDRPSLLMMYLDSARMRWYRYVINWSLQDQRLFASSVQRQARDASLALAWPRGWRGKAWYLAPVVVGAVIAFAWFLRHGGSVGPTRQSRGRPPRFYERALKALARRGFSPEPAETARQFCTRAQLGAPALADSLAAITAAYERARFGLSVPTEDELHEVERYLAVLERR